MSKTKRWRSKKKLLSAKAQLERNKRLIEATTKGTPAGSRYSNND
jgi:hypothetical protein